MNINYPPSVDTFKKKLAFVLRIIECYRQAHNFMGYWKNTGFLTETKYNNGLNQIPAPAKDWILDNYPYTSHGEFLSEGVYNAFIENKWEQRYSWIFHYRNEHIQHFYDDGSDDSIINLDTVLTEP